MKIKHLLIGMLAMAAAAACQEEVPVVEPVLEVDKTEVSVAATAAEATFKVTANNAWTATADADWVTLDPAAGEGGAEAVAVKVTAEDNTAEEARTATVTVKSGELTKTVKVAQAAKTATEEPEPDKPVVEEKTYILVGDAVGGWNVDENGVVLTLDGTTDGYYVAKAVEVTGQKGMHFTKNSSWEGNVKGKHGLIAPNEIGEVGGNDISLTESGTYDVYLTEALDKFYFMSDGKLPSEAVEHVELATVWGVCGAYGNNDWGNGDPDVVLVQDGEWYVAKNIEFTEVSFKVRGNNSWADDLKWGREAEDTKCALNVAIPVSTCTDYKEANAGATDNPGIYIGGEGTYDVYFSPEKKEVWVMTPGYKPGDETPEPEPVEVTYTLTGTVEGHYWENNAAAGLMTQEGDYYVVKNISLLLDSTMKPDGENPADYVKFKICETGTWNAYGVATENADVKYAPNAEIPVVSGGSDIFVDGAGTYDVYFDKTNGKVWVMTAGYKPGDDVPVPQPAFEAGTYWIMGTKDGATKAMMPLEGKSYGYASSEAVVDGVSYAENVFTITAVEGGYTIQDPAGQYYYQTEGTTYKTFNVGTDATLPGCVWTITKNEDETYDVVNVASQKHLRYAEGTYTSFGVYAESEYNGSVAVNLVPAANASARPVLDLTPKTASVGYDVTTYSITVESNVAWTATASEGVSLDKTSGEGNATVVMTFAQNAGAEALSHTVKFVAGSLEKTFVLEQAAQTAPETATIVLSAAEKPCDDFPSTSAGVTTTTSYTIDSNEWTFSPSEGNKFSWYSDGYILWGKSGGYILLPSVEGKKLTKVTILTGKNASTNVMVGVYDKEGTAAVKGGEAITLNAKDSEFSWTLSGTEAGERYQLRVTSKHNAQLQTLTLVYE